MASIDEAFPSKYISAADLGGKEFTFVIANCNWETARDDRFLVVYFQNAKKGLRLNKTNARMIASITGTKDFELWGGREITLYPTTTEMNGETKDCVRIKHPPQARAGNGGSVQGGRRLPPGGPRDLPAVAVNQAGDEDMNDPVPF